MHLTQGVGIAIGSVTGIIVAIRIQVKTWWDKSKDKQRND